VLHSIRLYPFHKYIMKTFLNTVLAVSLQVAGAPTYDTELIRLLLKLVCAKAVDTTLSIMTFCITTLSIKG